MISPNQAFPGDYASAWVRLLEAAATAGMAIQSHNHPLSGRDGETLAMEWRLTDLPMPSACPS